MNNLQRTSVNPVQILFKQMDHLRCRGGALLGAAGFGAIETPYKILHAQAGVKLRRYENVEEDSKAALLIVPAPIKQAYIWDLAPQVSVVRRCQAQDMRVYLAEWTGTSDAERDLGLVDYGDRLLKACVDAVKFDSGKTKIILVGHSLGGVLAAIFSCLYPEQISALVLLEAPLHFGADAGNFAPLVAAMPDARPIEAIFGNVPGSFIDLISVIAAPHAFQWERYLDGVLSTADMDAFNTHMRVERWAHDEFPLPGKLFTEIVELLYRRDQLMTGKLAVGKRQIGPKDLVVPLLNVVDPRSTIIPSSSILPFHEAAASTSKELLEYRGDIGVGLQHVGVLVGASAHDIVWPAVFKWFSDLDLVD